MILALAVVVGLAASLVHHGGRAFRRIAAIPLRSAWLALLAFALQWPLLQAPAGPVQRIGMQQVLFLLSHLLLLGFVWRNRRLPGIQIVGLGVMCNLLVIAANGGFMPITPETLVQINPGSTLAQWPSALTTAIPRTSSCRGQRSGWGHCRISWSSRRHFRAPQLLAWAIC